MEKLLRFLKQASLVAGLMVLASCGGGGGGGGGSMPAAPSTVTGAVKTGVVVVPPAEYNQAGAVTAATGGGLNITSSGSTSANLKQGDIVYLPPDAAGGLTMPFAGRVVGTTTTNGVVTTQVTPVGVEDVYETLSWDIDTAKSGARIAGVIAPPNANVKFSQSPAVPVQAGLAVGGNLEYKDSKLTGTVDVSQDITLSTGQKVTIFASVDLSGVSVTSTGSYDIKKFASTSGWANASAIIKGTVSGKLGVKGKGDIPSLGDLIANAGVFNDLKHQAGDYFSLEGLDNNDKKGRFPLGGVILVPYAATAFTGNIPDAALVFLSQAPSVVLWLYVDASGKISISGEIGKRFTEATFEQGYKFDAVGTSLKATRVANTSIKGIEWYGNGTFDITQRLGLSAAADVFIGGIRPLNVNTFIGAEYTGKLTGEGVLAEYPTTNLTGNVCVQNNMWAGQELNANFRTKATIDVDLYFTKVDVGGVAEAHYSDKVFTWIGKDGVGVDFASKCVVSGPFGITASLAGADAATAGNALVALDYTTAFTNASVTPLAKTWKAIARCTGYTDLPFDLPESSAGIYQISLPVGKSYTIELQANNDNYGLIRSATTSINIPAAPQLDFNVASVNGSCTALNLTAVATPFSGGTITGYKWVVQLTGSVAQTINATTPSSNITLPSCGSTSVTVTATDSNGLSTSASRTVDTTQLAPAVTTLSTSPIPGMQGSALIFTANGQRLQPGYDLSMTGCTATELSSASTTQRQYTCVPSQTGTFTATLKTSSTGTVLATTSVTINTGSTPDTTPPTVLSTNPTNIATAVAVNTAITATFSETMTASTVTAATFTLNNGVTGTVTYTGTTATFTPSSNLAYSTTYTATITTGVKDAAGNAMAAAYTWTFTTASAPGSAPSAPTGINATAGNGQAIISWSSVSGATSYNIYWSTTSGVSKTSGTKIASVTSPYTHTGRTNGTIYYYVVTAVNSFGESAESSQVSATPTTAAAATGRMPDTNQTTSYTTTFGEDHDYTINPPSYTDNGDGTITDNVTGLTWQKQDDATTRTWADAGTYCDASTLGGYSDWRLPSQIELISIIDNGVYNPSINTIFFPGTVSSSYWSSTTDVVYASNAWHVVFNYGFSNNANKTISYYVRCVRGGQATPSLTDNGNGTVTDSGTLLIWQQGENSAMTWEAALTYCEGLSLAAQTDWRLPNHKELLSLLDYTRYNPSINTTMFPNAYSSVYWSSTTIVIDTSGAWHVNFGSGYSYYNKTYSNYVRCVRGGQ